MAQPIAPHLTGKRVVVMGLGRFGGGAGIARFAAAQGASVLISDKAPAESLAPGINAIQDLIDAGKVQLALGAHDPSHLDNADILIVNPAVPKPWDNPFIQTAEQRGITIETEIALATDTIQAQLTTPTTNPITIAITGSVGKSTTAAMIHHALQSLNIPTLLGGNIGGSLLENPETLKPHPHHPTIVVLELSSAMLHWLRKTRPTWGPDIAVLTGFEPNHLDWHASLDHYKAAKQWLLDAQTNKANQPSASPTPTAVLGTTVTDWPTPAGVARAQHISLGDITPVLPGAHNKQNATLAATAIHAALTTSQSKSHPDSQPDSQSNITQIAKAVAQFKGLPHRLAACGLVNGIHTYNDAKSTTPGTTAAAVAAVRERHQQVWLIAGGADKGVDLSSLAKLPLAGILTIGTTGPAIAHACQTAAMPAIQCHTLEHAVTQAMSHARPGDAILLSPACASWDQFPHYEARGQAFIQFLEQARTNTPNHANT